MAHPGDCCAYQCTAGLQSKTRLPFTHDCSQGTHLSPETLNAALAAPPAFGNDSENPLRMGQLFLACHLLLLLGSRPRDWGRRSGRRCAGTGLLG